MSTIEDMEKRRTELEAIASNPNNSPGIRNRASEERLNLFLLIQKDQQRQFEKQSARIQSDAERTARIDEVTEAITQADNSLSQMPIGDKRRDGTMERLLDLRLQLDKLCTFREA
jgi:hypothetical protein